MNMEHHHPLVEKIMLRISLIIVIFACFAIFYYFYLLFFPEKQIEYTNIPFPVVTKQVKPGQTIKVLIDFCKYTENIPSVKNIYLGQDNILIPVSGIVKQLPKGCFTNYLYDGYIVPIGTPPGIYHIQADLYYYLNPIGVFHAFYYTQNFKVL